MHLQWQGSPYRLASLLLVIVVRGSSHLWHHHHSISMQASPPDLIKTLASPICSHLPCPLTTAYPGLHGLSSAKAPGRSLINHPINPSTPRSPICTIP
jgi:hypothetical protein